MDGILLNSFQLDELENNANVFNSFFKILKFASTTPLFGHRSRSNQLGKTMLLYNLK